MRDPDDCDRLYLPDDEIVAEPVPREPRLVLLYEAHFGIGLRWATDEYMPFPLHLSLALPFITFEIGVGPRRHHSATAESPK